MPNIYNVLVVVSTVSRLANKAKQYDSLYFLQGKVVDDQESNQKEVQLPFLTFIL